MALLTGKTEIIYLLDKVIEKYEVENAVQIARNSNRKNYEGVARALSNISNQLPFTAESLQHDPYPKDYNPQNLDYPLRKYDITGNQIKDAYFNQIVSNPRAFMVDACYIYLFGVGRKGFEAQPTDENLLISAEIPPLSILPVETASSTENASKTEADKDWLKKSNRLLFVATLVLMGLMLFFLYKWRDSVGNFQNFKQDFKLMPYQPTAAEIDSLEGLWLAYIGSPQARLSDSNRFHIVVPNIVDIRYKNGYFTLTRYGANFDHEGYAQFESPWLVSLFTYVKNKNNQIESPRHSLLRLNKEKKWISVMSASWNFDVADKNDVIGIREVYAKQGKGGQIEEVINTIENASCKCKIIKWHKDDAPTQVFELKNQRLENLPDAELKALLDEESILLRVPKTGVLLGDSTKKR